MLEIRDVQIDGKADNRTDHLEPELAFALESDIPGTSLADAAVTVSGRTFGCGNNQTGFPLKGLALQPFTEYPVEIRARDNHGQEATAAASFRTGRLTLPWKASWITDKDYSFGKKQSPVPMTFRRTFTTTKPIHRAYITATAIGIYELTLNGEKVGDSYFAPGFTSYKKNLQYQFYDVTEQLVCSNTLIAVVAGGWAVGRFTYENKNKITAPRQALLLELFIEYTDGTAESVVTDNSWDVTLQGNYRKACLYDGETYDASVNLEAVRWKRADEVQLPFCPKITLENSRVICREILHPVSHFENSAGETIYDFGQNFAGVVELRIRGKAGQTITVRHAEVLEGDRLYTASLRTAKAEILYICKEGAQTYLPRLTYMGFRYIAVTGIAPEALEVKARVLPSDFEESGNFSCSNVLLNRLQSNIRWSALSNFVDIPTDCPQRDERQGWTGDIAVFASTACYNFNLSRFYEKWLKDMRLEQSRGGGIPTVVPIQGCSTPVVATACWGDSCILVPWAEYLARGNLELLRRQYPCMKRYMKAVRFWASLWLGRPEIYLEMALSVRRLVRAGGLYPELDGKGKVGRHSLLCQFLRPYGKDCRCAGRKGRRGILCRPSQKGLPGIPQCADRWKGQSPEEFSDRLRSSAVLWYGPGRKRKDHGGEPEPSGSRKGSSPEYRLYRDALSIVCAGRSRLYGYRLPGAAAGDLPLLALLRENGSHHALGAMERHYAGRQGARSLHEPLRLWRCWGFPVPPGAGIGSDRRRLSQISDTASARRRAYMGGWRHKNALRADLGTLGNP